MLSHTDLGFPSGVMASPRWGASWARARASQSCLCDSGSNSDCKNVNLRGEEVIKKRPVCLLTAVTGAGVTCAPPSVIGPNYPGMPGSGSSETWLLRQQALRWDRTVTGTLQPPRRASHTAWERAGEISARSTSRASLRGPTPAPTCGSERAGEVRSTAAAPSGCAATSAGLLAG